MRLFKVSTVYCNGDYIPACQEIIVIKETPTAYLVYATLASDHRSRISKELDGSDIGVTELEAWTKYIQKARRLLMAMGRDMTACINNVNHAILERAYLIEIQGVKIGGTD